MTTQFVTSKDGTKIAYEVAGSGPNLLIVNGAMGHRALSFARQLRVELAKRFTVIDYDRRGRGESGDSDAYAVAREVEDIAAVIAAHKGPVHVVAQSSGAALALEAAASGVPMASLFAYEPPYMVGDPKDKPDADFEAKMWQLRKDGRRSEAVAYFMRTVGVPGWALVIMRMMPFWKDGVAVAHTLPYDAAVMAGFDLPAKRLAKVKVPTMLAAGGKTTPTLKAGAEAASKAVPSARFQLVPKMTHAIKPAVLGPALEAFIQETASAGKRS